MSIHIKLYVYGLQDIMSPLQKTANLPYTVYGHNKYHMVTRNGLKLYKERSNVLLLLLSALSSSSLHPTILQR